MRVSVFGLGYVGCVSASCLAADGHEVVGVDVNGDKVDQVRRGLSPVLEPGLQNLLQGAVESGKLTATCDAHWAVANTDVSLICVGTPSRANGSLQLDFVKSVCRQIGAALAEQREYHVVAVRSTILPGSVEGCLVPILETCSAKTSGEGFGVAVVPEFLREGSAIDDFFSPSLTVIGADDDRSAATVSELFMRGPEISHTTVAVAQMVKYVCNSYHALKVAFANEVGSLCKVHGIDGRSVMDIFTRDTKLNISATYLRPGYAFGGSCLPKDTRALAYRAKERDVELPVLLATLASNDLHIRRSIEMVERAGHRKVGILGLSFKPGTDDIRESPAVPLVETLIGRGYEVCIFDEYVDPERLIGANRSYIEQQVPHIAALMAPSIEAVLARAQTLVVTNGSASFRDVGRRLRSDQTLVDLAGVSRTEADGGRYEGICW